MDKGCLYAWEQERSRQAGMYCFTTSIKGCSQWASLQNMINALQFSISLLWTLLMRLKASKPRSRWGLGKHLIQSSLALHSTPCCHSTTFRGRNPMNLCSPILISSSGYSFINTSQFFKLPNWMRLKHQWWVIFFYSQTYTE